MSLNKGIVERAHDYFGEVVSCRDAGSRGPRISTISCSTGWAWSTPGGGGVLGCAPTDRIGGDRQAMLTCPGGPGWSGGATAPGWPAITTSGWTQRLLGASRGDRTAHRVLADLDRCRCSVQAVVADHERVWAWHQTITDPEHRQAANMLRHNRISALPPASDHDGHPTVEQRSLSDYDTPLGIELNEGGYAS